MSSKLRIFTRIFSAQNRQKNKNIQPGPEKQYSYRKKECIPEEECKFDSFQYSYIDENDIGRHDSLPGIACVADELSPGIVRSL